MSPRAAPTASLSDEATRELWLQFKTTGAADLRARLVERYLPLARTAAARHCRLSAGQAVSFPDCLQYARLGLIEAIDRFDPAREASFETYSSYRIRGAMLNGLARENEVVAQRSFWRTRREERVHSLSPSVTSTGDEELAELARMTVGLAIGYLLESGHEEPVDETSQANPYSATELAQLRQAVTAAVANLPGREQQLIRRHYFEDREFRVIAAELSVTPGRVSQLHAQALEHIRALLKARPKLDRKV
jgi:RNA polymerase sigma factor for flagellar operon FliA